LPLAAAAGPADKAKAGKAVWAAWVEAALANATTLAAARTPPDAHADAASRLATALLNADAALDEVATAPAGDLTWAADDDDAADLGGLDAEDEVLIVGEGGRNLTAHTGSGAAAGTGSGAAAPASRGASPAPTTGAAPPGGGGGATDGGAAAAAAPNAPPASTKRPPLFVSFTTQRLVMKDGRRYLRFWLVDSAGKKHRAVAGVEKDTRDAHYTYQAIAPPHPAWWGPLGKTGKVGNGETVTQWLVRVMDSSRRKQARASPSRSRSQSRSRASSASASEVEDGDEEREDGSGSGSGSGSEEEEDAMAAAAGAAAGGPIGGLAGFPEDARTSLGAPRPGRVWKTLAQRKAWAADVAEAGKAAGGGAGLIRLAFVSAMLSVRAAAPVRVLQEKAAAEAAAAAEEEEAVREEEASRRARAAKERAKAERSRKNAEAREADRAAALHEEEARKAKQAKDRAAMAKKREAQAAERRAREDEARALKAARAAEEAEAKAAAAGPPPPPPPPPHPPATITPTAPTAQLPAVGDEEMVEGGGADRKRPSAGPAATADPVAPDGGREPPPKLARQE